MSEEPSEHGEVAGSEVDATGVTPARPARPWIRRVLLGIGVGAVVVAAVPAVVVFPYFRDDYRMDGVVRAVALDWRDFGLERARARLEYELDHQGIGMQLSEDDCALEADEAGALRVRCAWSVSIEVPVAEVVVPLAFESRAEIAPDGDLR